MGEEVHASPCGCLVGFLGGEVLETTHDQKTTRDQTRTTQVLFYKLYPLARRYAKCCHHSAGCAGKATVIGKITNLNLKAPSLRGSLARKALGSIMLKLAYTLLSFGVAVVLARVLGPAGYGVYAFVFALVTLLAVPAKFGLPNLVVRETAKHIANGEWGLVQGVWRWAGSITGVIALALAVLAGGVLWFWGEQFSTAHVMTLAWGLALVPLVALGDLRGAALRGLDKVLQGQFPEMILRPSLFLILLLATTLVLPMGELSAATAMALQVAAAAAAFAIGAWLLWRTTPQSVSDASPRYERRRWLASTLPLAFTSGMQLINQYTDIIMLGLFVSAAEVGVYRVAAQVSLLVSFGLSAINMVVAPRFARLYANSDMAKLQRLVTVSARAILLCSLPVVAIVIFFGKPLLTLIFGAEFTPAYVPLAILVLGQLVNSAMGSVAFLLNMTGHERDTARGAAIAACGNVMLNLLLIPLFGTAGAAIATATTFTVWNILLWRAVHTRLDIDSMAFKFTKPGRAS